MARMITKVKGIVSIALFLMLALTIFTGLQGVESDGSGSEGGHIHIVSAAILGLLAIVHILLNLKVLVFQIKALLGIDGQ